MEEKSYCIIGLDKVDGLKKDLMSIATKPLNLVNSEKKTVLVATFNSYLDPIGIKKVLNVGKGRTFFLFEINPKSCAVHIEEEHLQEFLFKSFDESSEVYENELFEASHEFEYDEEMLKGLGEDEREILIDKLLTNAPKLTDNEKKALAFLASI
jgi:hypothetical protein